LGESQVANQEGRGVRRNNILSKVKISHCFDLGPNSAIRILLWMRLVHVSVFIKADAAREADNLSIDVFLCRAWK
jgi:hypothetical protein